MLRDLQSYKHNTVANIMFVRFHSLMTLLAYSLFERYACISTYPILLWLIFNSHCARHSLQQLVGRLYFLWQRFVTCIGASLISTGILRSSSCWMSQAYSTLLQAFGNPKAVSPYSIKVWRVNMWSKVMNPYEILPIQLNIVYPSLST